MKKILFALLALFMAVSSAACAANEKKNSNLPETTESVTPAIAPTPMATPDPGPFEGKIGFITNSLDCNEEEYRAAQQAIEKYSNGDKGKRGVYEKFTHVTWPTNFMAEQEYMVEIAAKLASDPEIKAIIINQAVPGTKAVIDKIRGINPDVFVVCIEPQDGPDDMVQRANLTMIPDYLGMGATMVEQAHKLGAKTLIHYSFPRHMSQNMIKSRFDLMGEVCAEYGIELLYVAAPDPTAGGGMAATQEFILEDVPEQIEKHGKDTAFFATNCGTQVPLIKAVLDNGGLYPQPCCPSPYHGFPAALGLEYVTDDGLARFPSADEVIEGIKAALAEKNMLGRVSTWPVGSPMMTTDVSVRYAIKWINGAVPKDGIDADALEKLMSE